MNSLISVYNEMTHAIVYTASVLQTAGVIITRFRFRVGVSFPFRFITYLDRQTVCRFIDPNSKYKSHILAERHTFRPGREKQYQSLVKYHFYRTF